MLDQRVRALVRELRDSGIESPYLDRLRARLDPARAQGELEKELVREMALALGRTEDKLNVALLRLELGLQGLARAADDEERARCTAHVRGLRAEALRARHELLIHREAVGIRRNECLETIYPIPALPRR